MMFPALTEKQIHLFPLQQRILVYDLNGFLEKVFIYPASHIQAYETLHGKKMTMPELADFITSMIDHSNTLLVEVEADDVPDHYWYLYPIAMGSELTH